MPSFGDGHAHPLYGGLESAGPAVRPCKSVDEIVSAVAKYAAEHPDDDWIIGASYESSLAPGGLFDARWLDAAVPDRPVVLRAWDYHTMWCNSVALQRAGITADTPDPVLGEIPHREDGSVLGTLREWGAMDLMNAVMPAHDENVRVAALGTAADYYLARGVTWVQDAWVEPADVDTYIAAARRDALGVRFNLAFYADPRHFDSQVTTFADARRRVDEVGSPLLTAQTVKFFADGVVENETGALLQPYCTALHNHGQRNWEGDSLAEAARPGRRTGSADPHPRDRRCGCAPGTRCHRACGAAQRPARPAAGDRARPAGRRRRHRPVRRARRHPEHAAAVGAAGRTDDGADGAAPRDRTLPTSSIGSAASKSPVRHWHSAPTGRCPRARRWTGFRWRCRGRPSRRRARGRMDPRRRSSRSSGRCPRTRRAWRIRRSPKTAGARSRPAPAPTCSGWTAIPEPLRALELPALQVRATYLRGRPVYSATN